MPTDASRPKTTVRPSRFGLKDVGRLLALWALSVLALGFSTLILSGLHTDGWAPLVIASLFMGVLGTILRPLLVAGSLILGWIGVLLAALLAQAIIVQVAVDLTPGMTSDDLLTSFLAGLITGLLTTLATWAATAGTEEAFLTSLVRQRGRDRRRATRVDDGLDGVVFIQLDGAPFQVVTWGVNSGTLPTLSRWVRSGSHQLNRWEVQIPCTTPVSQAGILHGTFEGLAAFRWFDRETRRVVVASKPADMAQTEARISDGLGLLADGGVSVGNIFSGDAPTALATMSRLGATHDPGPARRFSRYLTQPNGLFRSLFRSFAELVRDRHEARRQVHRDVQPRIRRTTSFALVRAATNGLLRDMNTALVADAMLGGARSIYVDLVDYDEVAHHAGPLRQESLRALENLDGVLGALEQVAEVAPRHYHFVILSDHGQSQGETFADRFGQPLSELVHALTGEQQFEAVDEEVEGWGRVNLLRSTVASSAGVASKVADAGENTTNEHIESERPSDDNWVVLGSGNLGLVYANGPDRLSLEELDSRWPRLVPGLAAHPGISFVVVRSSQGPVAIGAEGCRYLAVDRVEGTDPLARFPGVADDLRRAAEGADAPDVYVNSLLDSGTEEVAAFEELVGCHGGAGGWQTSGTLLSPVSWPIPDGLHGADNVHRMLVGWLEALGHRTGLGSPTGAAVDEPPQQPSPSVH